MRKYLRTAVLTALLMAGFVVKMPGEAAAAVLPNGLYVGDYDLGGMTEEEAEQTIKSYINNLSKQKVVLDIEGEKVQTSARELGYYWSNEDAVREVTGQLTKGNLIKRYMALADLEETPMELPLETSVEDTKVEAFIEQRCSAFVTQAANAAITRENNTFVITDSMPGKKVDIEATKQALNEALSQDLNDVVEVFAVVLEEQPVRTKGNLETIQDVLGTFSTSYASSGASRATNLSVGSRKINGAVLMPGETMSGYELMHPFTSENGYATAAAYENGQVVDSVGGGVCQISTTLFNAALLAELTIAQRQNHSMTVSYVKPSQDAAIAGTYKDLKLTNNYSTPIYIEASADKRVLTFTIYGKETRPANRTIKFVSETLGTTNAGDPILRIDSTLAPQQRVTVQSGHNGLRSRLWKYVYVDGVETEKTILHTDTYNASKAIVRVGPTMPETQAPVETLPLETLPVETQTQPSTETQPQPQPTEIVPQEGVDGGPGVSATQASKETPPISNSNQTSASQGQTAAQTAPVPTQPAAQTPTQAATQAQTQAPAETPAAAPAATEAAPAAPAA